VEPEEHNKETMLKNIEPEKLTTTSLLCVLLILETRSNFACKSIFILGFAQLLISQAVSGFKTISVFT
jgi:hypothetical protein